MKLNIINFVSHHKITIMRYLFLLIIFFHSYNFAVSQVDSKRCITTNLIKKELQENPNYELMRSNFINYNNKRKNTLNKNHTAITIPIVIHVVHRAQDNIGNNTNISDAQIEDQLRILNEDYSKTNPEFPNPPRNNFVNYAGNPQIQFCLATTDPNGNPTSGITRTSTSQTSWNADDPNEQNYMKLTSQGGIDNWDPLRYLNIWVCNLTNSGGGQTLGYAYLPGLQGSSSQSWKDGIVIDYQHFGSTGNVSWSSDGRTATHEVGHYLGLSHTFCESGTCCDNDLNSQYSWGDIYDTPASDDDIYFGTVNSNTNNNTCNDNNYSNNFTSDVLDMDENYMSYARDQWMFSQGQVDAMIATLGAPTSSGGRLLLRNSPVSVNCSGLPSWDCDGQGNCDDPGDGTGSFSSYNDCVSFCGCTSNIYQISEGFQTGSLPNGWSVDNPDSDQTWQINSNYGYNSTSSIVIENSIYAANGQYDDLISPTLNFTAANTVALTFDYAYSLWTNPNSSQIWSDTLIILVSSDCGISWQKVWENAGVNLVTTSPVYNEFEWFPSGNNDWKSVAINLDNYSSLDGVIIKFRNVNQYENNLFLDNINIVSDATTDINEYSTNKKLIYISDIFGRQTNEYGNKVLFYIYDDGTVEKKIILE